MATRFSLKDLTVTLPKASEPVTQKNELPLGGSSNSAQPQGPASQGPRQRVQPPQVAVVPATAVPVGAPLRMPEPVTSKALAVVPPQHDEVPLRSAPEGEASFSLENMSKILLDLKVRPSHVGVALRRAAETGEPLSQIMRDFGFLSGERVAEAVSLQTKYPYFSMEQADGILRSDLAGIAMPAFKRFVPVGLDELKRLVIAVPDASFISEATNEFYARKSTIVIASEHTIQTVFRRHFANTEKTFRDAVKAFKESMEAGRRKEEEERSVGLVRDVYFSLLRHACYSGASDLYLHKSEYVGIVRLKINGVGQIFQTIDLTLYDRLLNKLVQDNSKADDLRMRPKEAIVDFLPEEKEKHSDLATRFNFRLELTESRGVRSAVIRILDKNSAATDIDKLGFDSDTFKAINRISKTATGFFLVTGPTGSGKTTTLYAILKSIDAVERSVQSIENPVEYEHGLWMQFEPRKDSNNEGEELNEWLKALLRNAPDVILVGEVRDKNVANVCLNAANTGHLVFATLHTNDAVMAVARLKSLQIDLDVLASVLLGILAQRLIRVLCKQCKVPDTSEDTAEMLAEAPYLASVLKSACTSGGGCANCDYTGYRGRRMIYELLQMSPGVRAALETGEPPSAIAKQGMPPDKTMWADGLKLVAQGTTSLDELMRVATRHN